MAKNRRNPFIPPFLNFTIPICLILLVSLFSTTPLFADWLHRPNIGLGYTSNANFEEHQPDADIYWQAKSSSIYSNPSFHVAMFASFSDYLSESQNDVFTWRLSPSIPLKSWRKFTADLNFALGGQNFVNDPPAATEESFDYIFIESSLTLEKKLHGQWSFIGEPGVQIRNYKNFDDRSDFLIFADTQLNWIGSSGHIIEPTLGIGLASSSDELYSRRYIEIGVGWRYDRFRKDLKLSSRFTRRSTAFPNRTVSQTTAISRGRGRLISSNSESIEVQAHTQLQFAVTKLFGEVEWINTIVLNQQDSKSGIEDYNEIGIITSITKRF